MVTIYSYTPQSADKKGKAVCLAILGTAGVLILLSELFAEYKPVLMTAGFIIALFGILACTRFLMTSYTYSLESGADGTPPDLVIREMRGKVNRIVCRVSVSGGKLRHDNKKNKPRGAVYDYRPSPFSEGPRIFEVSERDGGGFVRFNPDEAMIDIMRSSGCEVEE